jgi:hypothetical protein
MGLQEVAHGRPEPALSEAVNDSDAGRIGEKGIVEELINEWHRFINPHPDYLERGAAHLNGSPCFAPRTPVASGE